MNAHLRANLWLLGLTVLLCCVLYPLTLWAIGQTVFPDQASGSFLDENGQPTRDVEKARGSRLIAQPFTDAHPEYFQPRPSAASYNGGASGASNYGASNPKLRYRVAQALGPIVKYRSGPKKAQLAGPDIEKWFQAQDHPSKGEPLYLVAQWAKMHSDSAKAWVDEDKLNSEYISAWQNAHPKEVEEWLKENPDISKPEPKDLAVPFFVSFSHTFPGTWPGAVEVQENGETKKKILPVAEDSHIQANFFDGWLQEHPDVELVEVPADLVMASGSGLDPHITLANAHYQLDRVVEAWVKKTEAKPEAVRTVIENLLKKQASAPFGGLAGAELINVLEVNLALPEAMKGITK
jgi:potassium-transporting ATPase KdpC subunit